MEYQNIMSSCVKNEAKNVRMVEKMSEWKWQNVRMYITTKYSLL